METILKQGIERDTPVGSRVSVRWPGLLGEQSGMPVIDLEYPGQMLDGVITRGEHPTGILADLLHLLLKIEFLSMHAPGAYRELDTGRTRSDIKAVRSAMDTVMRLECRGVRCKVVIA